LVAGTTATASPAAAQPSGDTTVSFTVAAAALVIDVPASSSAGSGVPGEAIDASLGTVEVIDERAVASATWTASVTTTAFTTGGGGDQRTVPPGQISYWSGPETATTGAGTFTPGQATAAEQVVLGAPRTAFSKESGDGNNTASWNPTLVIAIPADAIGGLYSGTVTHSVA
jgi:hypothetical protein